VNEGVRPEEGELSEEEKALPYTGRSTEKEKYAKRKKSRSPPWVKTGGERDETGRLPSKRDG